MRAELDRAGLGDRVIGIFADQLRASDRDVLALDELAARSHDLLVIGEDARKAELLNAYRRAAGEREPPPDAVLAGTGHLAFADADFEELDTPALVPSCATGSPYTREHLLACLKAAATAGLRGAIVEFGAFKGGTTAWLARAAAHLGLDGCRIIGLDSWAGFPRRRSLLDLYEHPRCVFTDLDAVRAYVEPLGVELIAGDITDTYRQLDGVPLLLAFFSTPTTTARRGQRSSCAPTSW